jgi:AbrB family looped-hinge helix DNA binding protein
MTETCTVDKQGRILIPSKTRTFLRATPGSELVISTNPDGSVTLSTREGALTAIQQRLRARVGPGRSIVDEFLAERRRLTDGDEG